MEIANTIPIDSIYSPVQKVRFAVEDTRVGHRSDYDKLILEVWTDGTINPEDALAEAAKIAKEHFTIFINFNENDVVTQEEVSEDEIILKKLLNTSVDELELSVRSSNCLQEREDRKNRRADQEI
jgi:DNA-directed RNA polymerase subunit alpha